MEGASGTAARGHQLCAHGDTDIDRAVGDLVRDILGGLQARGAEAVDGGGGGGVGESGSQGGGTDEVGSAAF